MSSDKLKILVTGGSGFIGPRLIEKLEKRTDLDVWALLRYVTGRYVLGKNVKTVFADIRDPVAVKNSMRLVQPDYIIHLTAISPVAYSYDKYTEVIETNFNGTAILAEAAMRECPDFRQFIYAGTSEEYGNQVDFPIKETARCHPNSPYAVAKNAGKLYLDYMGDAYGFPYTVLRPFNTFGRTDNTHFVTERIASQMLLGQEVRLGDPNPSRDFLYVDDHVNGYLHALGSDLAIGNVFNICSGRDVTIKELAEKIAEITGWKGEVEWNTIPPRPLDIDVLVGDNRKAWNSLGWRPRYSLETGLIKTVDNLRQSLNLS
jgi:dTDP-glucose 4,6-dehydratase